MPLDATMPTTVLRGKAIIATVHQYHLNKAKADKPYDARAASGIPGAQMHPVPEPESWREIIIRCASENSVWRTYVDENKQWSDLGRKAQLSIADFVECNRR